MEFIPMRYFVLIFGFAILFTRAPIESSHAQLSRDLQNIFEAMLDDLDEDLKLKFEEAIESDSSVVKFSREQFRRFKQSPVNPFDGLKSVAVNPSGTIIALKFELPDIRNRPVHPLERQSSGLLASLRPAIKDAAKSSVLVYSNNRAVAMGTIFRDDGYILTKASELDNTDTIRCKLFNSIEKRARLVEVNQENDLAILKIDAEGLVPAKWANRSASIGNFLLTPDPFGNVLALGTYSVATRSTAVGQQAFLGVQPETTSGGVRISEIQPGTASALAGLKNGDIITKLNQSSVTDASSLVKAIRDRAPGDQIEIEYNRNGELQSTTATLAAREYSGEQAARFKMMNRLGAVPSQRYDNFPSVFQHDSPLFPEDCGGPITNLDGDIVGVNIARLGRAASYAIPSSTIQSLISKYDSDAKLPRLNIRTRQ
jgi:serine protease Do